MQKQYISIMNLLKESSDYLRTKESYLSIRGPGHDEPEEEQRRSLFSIEPYSEDPSLQKVTVVRSVCNLSVGRAFIIPYLVEEEYLRTSHFNLTDIELDMLHQILVLQIIVYLHIEGRELNSLRLTDENIESVFGEYLHKIDIDETPEWIEEQLMAIYKEKFIPFQPASNASGQKHKIGWFALPVSSLSGYQVPPIRWTDNYYGSEGHRDSYMMLFMPLIMVFSLLEAQTDALKTYTYADYMAYRDSISHRYRFDGIIEDHTRLEVFSYGFETRRRLAVEQDDCQFIIYITRKILEQMRTVIQTHNKIKTSICELADYNVEQWGNTIALDLTQSKLNWSTTDED